MNDTPVACQNPSVTEPQRDGGSRKRDGEGDGTTPQRVILSGGIAGVELLGATRLRGAYKSARRQPTRDLETSLAGLPPFGYIPLCRQKCK